MNMNSVLTENKNFRIVLTRSESAPLPKKLSGEEHVFNCFIEPTNHEKIPFNDENILLLKKALLKLLRLIRQKINFDKKLTYFGELAVSFKNLKKKWIRSSIFNINSAYSKNIVYSTLNKIGKYIFFIPLIDTPI